MCRAHNNATRRVSSRVPSPPQGHCPHFQSSTPGTPSAMGGGWVSTMLALLLRSKRASSVHEAECQLYVDLLLFLRRPMNQPPLAAMDDTAVSSGSVNMASDAASSVLPAAEPDACNNGLQTPNDLSAGNPTTFVHPQASQVS